jgi:hypothetical protein
METVLKHGKSGISDYLGFGKLNETINGSKNGFDVDLVRSIVGVAWTCSLAFILIISSLLFSAVLLQLWCLATRK